MNETSAPSRYIPGLNGVRAIAVTAVVWHHTHQPIRGWPITGQGFLGVDVFFVLSGFLITTLLLQERDARGSVSLRRFYLRRVRRIFPLYYAVLSLLTIYFLLSHSNQREPFFKELPSHLLFFSNWIPVVTMVGITWSLSTEEQYYFVWPRLLVSLGNQAVWFLLAFLAANEALNFGLFDRWLQFNSTPVASLSILQVTFTPIILGSLLAYGMRSPLLRVLGKAHRGWPGLACVAFLVIANVDTDIRGWPRLTLQLLATVGLAGIVLRPKSLVARLLEWRPLAYVGTVSYGVYLLHLLVLDAVLRVLRIIDLDASFWAFPVCLTASVFVAALSFEHFESRFTKSRSSFVRDEPPRRSAAEPSGAAQIGPGGASEPLR